MNKIGTLEQVQDNNILIDGTWYDASDIIQYVPKSTGVQVEYGDDGNGKVQFIRTKKASSYAPKGNTFTPKRKSYTPKNTTDRSNSIIKQVLMKIASEQVANFTFNSVDEALEALDDTYKQLKDKYLEELK